MPKKTAGQTPIESGEASDQFPEGTLPSNDVQNPDIEWLSPTEDTFLASDPDADDDDDIESEDTGDDVLFQHNRIVADRKQGLIRLDKFLTDRLQGASRNRIQVAIDNGFIKVNDEVVKTSYKVKPLDVITVSLPKPPRVTDVIPQNIPLNIVYEDDALLVVNKAAGMVVHPAYGNYDGTLVNALVYHFENMPVGANGVGRPGLVHRIDKDTSGLLVIAKTEEAMTHLAAQFFYHTIERTYTALVWGIPEEEEGTINVNLGRHPKDRRVTAPFPNGLQGKTAITHYKLIEPLRYVSVVQCNLETGRTHQIRAHMRYLGHPVFADAVYGGDSILKGNVTGKYKAFVQNCINLCPRQTLHAKSLGFVHPTTGRFLQFEAPLPPDMAACIDKWRNYLSHL